MDRYGKIDGRLLEELKAAAGENNVFTDTAKLAEYSHDEVPANSYDREYIAEALVFPESTDQVSAVVKLAAQHNIPVTCRGAGTGLSGGAVPAFGGIVLCFEKMNRIIELDEANFTITVETGVITDDIVKLAREHNLLYAGDPCSGDKSQIGGNIAENAGGNKVVKYGATGAQLLALEAVLADGTVTWFGGKRRKDVTGFDFVHLLAGSEGTLAIITKAVLKLLPLPKYSADLLAEFADADSAMALVPKIIAEAGLIPVSIEFMDRNSLSFVSRCLKREVPACSSGAALIIQLESSDIETLETDCKKVAETAARYGAQKISLAKTDAEKENLWTARKSIADSIAKLCENYVKEDLVVPADKVPALLFSIEKACAKYGLESSVYGHAGDGNMHCTLIAGDKENWKDLLHKAQKDIYADTKKLGGTLSGEHGIGLKRREYIKYFLDDAQIELIKRVKLAFDPQNILNPGKIVEWE
ncbi:MAG: FAD-binding protein [Synergistaceae bacterium]|nr:FAD-binding protein [Candidatus Equadaptatus faecalis]